MKPALRFAAVVLLLAAASSQAGAEGGYQLARPAKFVIGDTATRAFTQTYRTWSTDDQGQAISQRLTVIDSTEKQSVTAVSQSGQVSEFLQQLVSAEMRYTFTAADLPTETATVNLSDVYCLARRDGRDFRANTSSSAGSADTSLSATRLSLLKRFMNDRMDFHACPAAAAALMPAEPVTVAQKWRPSQDTLLAWLQRSSGKGKLAISQASAEFMLASVDAGGVAVVRGAVAFAINLADGSATVNMKLSCRIDTNTGRWLSVSIDSDLTARAPQATFRANAMSVGTTIFQTCGLAAPTTMPAELNALGWPRPAPDTNRFRSAAYGISLNVPAQFTRKETAAAGDPILFSGPGGRSIAIKLKESRRPMDIDELAKIVIGNFKQSVPGCTILRNSAVTLASKVPARLVIAHGHDNAVTLVTLFAIEGMRLVSVSLAAPSGPDADVVEMTRIARSLRIFDPDLSAKQ